MDANILSWIVPGGIPVTVGVTMFILSIGDLSEKFMDFTFDMYFRQVDRNIDLVFTRHKAVVHFIFNEHHHHTLQHLTVIIIISYMQTWVDPRLTFEKHPDLDKLMVSWVRDLKWEEKEKKK